MNARLWPVLALLAAACTNTTCLDCGNRTGVLLASPSTVALTPSAPTAVLHTRQTGAGALPWRAALKLQGSWLALQPDSGQAGDSLTVSLDPSGLRVGAIGDYADTVVVLSVLTATSVSVPVTLVITAPVLGIQGLGLFQADGVTPIANGGLADSDVVVVKGTVTNGPAQLAVEMRPIGEVFTGVAVATSVSGTGTESVRIAWLPPHTTFHWQARAANATAASPWVAGPQFSAP